MSKSSAKSSFSEKCRIAELLLVYNFSAAQQKCDDCTQEIKF